MRKVLHIDCCTMEVLYVRGLENAVESGKLG
jgi:hypothetical protein